MGHSHGRVRFHWRYVSLLRRSTRDRSIVAGRCLHFRLSAPARSVARRFDEIAGENFGREVVRRAKTRTYEETERGARVKLEHGEAQGSAVSSLPGRSEDRTFFG